MSPVQALQDWFNSLTYGQKLEVLDFVYGKTLVKIPVREGRYCGPAPALTYTGKGLFCGPAPRSAQDIPRGTCPTCGKPW